MQVSGENVLQDSPMPLMENRIHSLKVKCYFLEKEKHRNIGLERHLEVIYFFPSEKKKETHCTPLSPLILNLPGAWTQEEFLKGLLNE